MKNLWAKITKNPRYRILFFIVLVAPLFFLLKNLTQKSEFSLAEKAFGGYTVTEKGAIRSVTDGNKDFAEVYKIEAGIASQSGNITIKGKKKSKREARYRQGYFEFTAIANSVESFCPKSLDIEYPLDDLRIFYYFFPKGYLFEGKKWQGVFCQNGFTCDYSVTKDDENEALIDMTCSGKIDSADVKIVSEMAFSEKELIFNAITADTVIKSGDTESSWHSEEKLEYIKNEIMPL